MRAVLLVALLALGSCSRPTPPDVAQAPAPTPTRVSVAGRTLTDAAMQAGLRDRFERAPRSELDLQRRRARVASEWIDEQLVRAEAQRRGLAGWATLDTSELAMRLIGPPPPITAEQERAFYDEHAHLYRREAHVRANKIVLFNYPEKPGRLVELRRVRAQIAGGTGFVGMASRVSEAGSREVGGDMGKVTASVVEPEIWSALSRLEEGEMSEVLDLDDRAVLLRRRERREALSISFDEAREDVRARINARRGRARRAALMKDLRARGAIEDAEAARLATLEHRRNRPRELARFEHILSESPARLVNR